MFVAAGLIASGRGVGQAWQYVVTELSPGVPCKLNNVGDIAGRTGGAFEGKLRAAVFRAREDSFTVVFYGLLIFDVKIAQFRETRRKPEIG
jgi:hypothetical protein